MASFSYSCTPLSVSVTVRGVSKGDMVRFFVRLDSSSEAVIDEQYESSGTSLTKTFPGLKAETRYAVNAGVVSGGRTDWIGAVTFTTPAEGSGGGGGETAVRPPNWSWRSTVRSGSAISLSADEWNAFCDRINAFREYAELRPYLFTNVRSGYAISASIVNQAVEAIDGIGTAGMPPNRVYSGDAITAAFFLRLQDALNMTR